MLKLKLTISEFEYPLDIITFHDNNGNNFFLLRSSQNSDITITIPYILPLNQDFKKENFSCKPFVSPLFYKEDNIFEVHVEEKAVGRIGWIFPIQSLLSNEHSKSDDEHFLRYAYVTFHKLLCGEVFENDIIFELSSSNAEVSISNIYNTELIILTLSHDKANRIHDFEMFNYIHSFYKYYYFFCQNQSEINELVKINEESNVIKKIKITQLSVFLRDEIFIKSLFKYHLKLGNHPLVQFHLLYQIIELLINRVYDCEVEKVIAASNSKSKSSHELGQDLSKLISEEVRIKKIIQNYLSKPLYSTKELVRVCNEMLIKFGKEREHIAEAFYQVRNIVVHDFRTIIKIDSDFKMLSDINKEFEKVLIEILNNYLEPNAFHNEPLAWLIYQMNFDT